MGTGLRGGASGLGESSPAPAPPAGTEGERIGPIDGFRAYAILGVVLLHLLLVSGVALGAEGTWRGIAIWGIDGNSLDVFFMISAFGLFLPVVRRGGDLGGLRGYALGRGARLLPPYWLVLVILLLLLWLVPPSGGLGLPSVWDVLIHFATLQMPARLFDPGLQSGFGLDGPLWMISVVAGFYLLFPLIVRAYFRRPLLGLALTAAVTIGWKELALQTDFFEWLAGGGTPAWVVELIASNQLPGWMFAFGLGLTGAWAYVRVRERYSSEQLARWALRALPVALLGWLAAAYWFGSASDVVSGPVTATLARADPLRAMSSSLSKAVLMALVLVGPLWMARPFANRFAKRLAELSYGIYVIHFVVIVYASDLLDLPRNGSLRTFVLWVAIVLPPSLLYAALVERLLERPVMARARRLRARLSS